MLGLGSNISKTGKLGVHDLGIVTSDLVLKHNYDLSSVQPLSDGAADINADAAANEYVTMGNIDIIGAGDFSIVLWAKASDWSTQYLVSKYADSSNYWYLRTDSSDLIEFRSKVSNATKLLCAGGTALTTHQNTWVHIAITADRDGNVISYINGVTHNTDTAEATDLDNSGDFKIGQVNTTEFAGYICNVGVWSAALSQAQIKSIMNKNYAGLTSSEKTDLVSWWNLDSVIDSADLGDGDTTVYDNHHGGGEVLGSELAVGDWLEQNGWTNITGGIRQDGTDGHTSISSEMTDFNGSVFKISYTLSNVTDPTNLKWKFGGGSLTAISGTEGDHVYYLTSDATADNFQLSTNNSWAGDVTNISVKLVNGNTGTLS